MLGLRPDPPHGYCASMNATQEEEGGAGGSTQGGRRLQAEEEEGEEVEGRGVWEEAARLVGRMEPGEKQRLVQGVGWRAFALRPGFYVGSILGVPRLGLPGINM